MEQSKKHNINEVNREGKLSYENYKKKDHKMDNMQNEKKTNPNNLVLRGNVNINTLLRSGSNEQDVYPKKKMYQKTKKDDVSLIDPRLSASPVQYAVSTKETTPEITQTTAKVSIGNTTISVPLLKPLNSASLNPLNQFIDESFKSKDESEGTQNKTQLNISKIVKLRSNSKVSSRVLSYSPAKISPVSSAKLVQAKVLHQNVPIQVRRLSKNTAINQSSISDIGFLAPVASPNNFSFSRQQDFSPILNLNSKRKYNDETFDSASKTEIDQKAGRSKSKSCSNNDMHSENQHMVTSKWKPKNSNEKINENIHQKYIKIDREKFQKSAVQSLQTSILPTIKTKTNLVPLHCKMPLRSKSTDDDSREVTRNINSKRYSLEAFPTKDCKTVQSHSRGANTLQIAEHLDIEISERSPTTSINISESADVENVLLKKLLQSTSDQTSNKEQPNTLPLALCNQDIASRKLVHLRAPCLGLVSSLEAQLARPVIPPVPTNTSYNQVSQIKANSSFKIYSIKRKMDDSDFISAQEIKKNKLNTKLITKETSFVSTHHSPPDDHDNEENINLPETYCVANAHERRTESETNIESNLTSERDFDLIDEPTVDCDNAENNHEISPRMDAVCCNDVYSKVNYEFQTNSSPHRGNKSFGNINVKEYYNRNENLKPKLDGKKSFLKLISQTSLHLVKCPVSTVNISTQKLSTDIYVSTTNSKSSNGKESLLQIEGQRKVRKRTYKKKKKLQGLHNNNDLTRNLDGISQLNSKKRRKLKNSEGDFDSFIESLSGRLQQLLPLPVQEPFLNNKNIVCNFNDFNLLIPRQSWEEKDENSNEIMFAKHCKLYHTEVNCICKKIKSWKWKNNLTKTHNGFYDQEFSEHLQKVSRKKLFDLLKSARERNIEVVDLVQKKKMFSNGISNFKTSPRLFLEESYFSGMRVVNNSFGRFSPILPVLQWNYDKRGNFCANIRAKLPPYVYDYMASNNCNKNQSSTYAAYETIILSMSALTSDKIFGVLRNLASILNIPTSKLKIVPGLNHSLTQNLWRNDTKTKKKKTNIKYTKLLTIIDGRTLICHTCGLILNSRDFRSRRSMIILKKFQMNTQKAFQLFIYFCNYKCVAEYKYSGQDLKGAGSNIFPSNNSNKNREQYTLIEKRYRYFKKGCFDNEIYNMSCRERADVLHTNSEDVYKKNEIKTLQNYHRSSSDIFKDTRQCVLCCERGDGLPNETSRLLNVGLNQWVHLNCALWSNGVYEEESGGLVNFNNIVNMSQTQFCNFCEKRGATIKCCRIRCDLNFHMLCALKSNCSFYKNKTVKCMEHSIQTEKTDRALSFNVQRRVFIKKNENKQIAAVINNPDQKNMFRIGSLIYLNIGQLLPHQYDAFHTDKYIYPVGYKVIRLYWSTKVLHGRSRYICSINEENGRPEFRVEIHETSENIIVFRDNSPNTVWQPILETISTLRKIHKSDKLFPSLLSGEELFGLTEPAIVRIIESLPGALALSRYCFKYGRNYLFEVPLALNPSGCARTEPKNPQILSLRKQNTQCAIPNQRHFPTTFFLSSETTCPYSKQFIHSKSSQYKKMKLDWRSNVYLARSNIQGLGLYAARDVDKHTMIIEYIGEVIRTEVSEIREKQFESKNRGIYMFRLDEDRVVDATLTGGLARYINHSCDPNCVTEIVEVDREARIIIFAKRRINRGEELSYDYKFDIEDEANKIPCMCGSVVCRKWMN